jgi:hypothetical protein
MEGDAELGRALIVRAGRMRDELGANVLVPITSLQSSRVEWLAGDPARAEAALQQDYDKLAGLGDRFVLPLIGSLLARSVCEQGRYEEAGELHATAQELADEGDVETQAILHSVRARLLLQDQDLAGAESAARAAVATLEGIESLDLRGDCLVTLAHVVAAAGRQDEVRTTLEQALDVYTAKGNLVSAERTRELVRELAPVAERAV